MTRAAFASDDGILLSAHPGHCAWFLVGEISESNVAWLERRPNPAGAHAPGSCGSECQHEGPDPHQAIANGIADCCVLITGGLGPRLAAALAQQGVEVIVARHGKVEDVARDYAAGKVDRGVGFGCERYG